MNWTFNVISYFNTVFISSLIFKKLNKAKLPISRSLKSAFSALEIICYTALLPSFFNSLKIAISEDNSEVNLKSKFLMAKFALLKFIINLLSNLLESYNEVIFCYMGMHGKFYFSMAHKDRKILTSGEFLLFRTLKFKNLILKMISVLYIAFFFLVNFQFIPIIKLPNSSLSDLPIFSFETFEFLCKNYSQFANVIFLCFSVVGSFISAIEAAFIASYCFKSQKM